MSMTDTGTVAWLESQGANTTLRTRSDAMIANKTKYLMMYYGWLWFDIKPKSFAAHSHTWQHAFENIQRNSSMHIGKEAVTLQGIILEIILGIVEL